MAVNLKRLHEHYSLSLSDTVASTCSCIACRTNLLNIFMANWMDAAERLEWNAPLIQDQMENLTRSLDSENPAATCSLLRAWIVGLTSPTTSAE